MNDTSLTPHCAGHLAAFMERLKVLHYSPATLACRGQSLIRFFRWLGGGADVRDVTKQTVRDYQEYLMGRYATQTVHVQLISLRRFFEHLEKTDALLVNPTEGVPLPKLEQRLPRTVLTPEEARRILDAPDTKTQMGVRDKAILETFYSTGIRLEEMTRLTVHDVDLSGYVRVNRGKGARDRVVPLGVKACDCVRDYLQQVRVEWATDNPDERALWLSWRWPHQPLKKQLISVMARKHAKAAGIAKPISPHVWRHTCATHLVKNKAGLRHVQELLGHRDLSTTERYLHLTIADLKEAHRQCHPREQGVES